MRYADAYGVERMRLFIVACLTLGACESKPSWQADALVIFADQGVLMADKYVRPEGSPVIEGSVMEDLRNCGIKQFEVFDFTGQLTDIDGFHVIAPRSEVIASHNCLKQKLPAGTHIKPYDPAGWPEGQGLTL